MLSAGNGRILRTEYRQTLAAGRALLPPPAADLRGTEQGKRCPLVLAVYFRAQAGGDSPSCARLLDKGEIPGWEGGLLLLLQRNGCLPGRQRAPLPKASRGAPQRYPPHRRELCASPPRAAGEPLSPSCLSLLSFCLEISEKRSTGGRAEHAPLPSAGAVASQPANTQTCLTDVRSPAATLSCALFGQNTRLPLTRQGGEERGAGMSPLQGASEILLVWRF